MNTAEVHTIREVTGLDALRDEWAEFHSRANGTVFQTFSWLSNWWKVYGPRGERLNIITVRIGGRLAGVLPLYLDRTGLPGMSLSRLRMIGIYETYGEYTLMVDPSAVGPCVKAIAAELARSLRDPSCDLLSIFRFPPDSGPMTSLIQELKALGLSARFIPVVIPRVLMNLPGSWDEYLASLSSNEREAIRRKTKALQKRGANFEVVESPSEQAFDDYARLHMESWNPRGVPGYFASKDFTAFTRAVTLEMMGSGRGRLYFLVKDGVRFAAVHAYFVNGQCCFYLSGLDRRHELANMSPGKVLLARVIKDAIEMGYSVFDFQGGNEGYKIRLGGTLSSFSKLLCWHPGARSIKINLFLGIQAARQGIQWRLNEKLLPALNTLRQRMGGAKSSGGEQKE